MADKDKKPQIRFNGFSNDWEQCKLGDFGNISMNKRIFKHQTSEEGDIPFYKIGTFGSEPDAFISKELFEEYKSRYPYPEKGDILLSASGSIGKTVEYTGNNEYFQDSNIIWLRHDNKVNNSFLKHFYSIVKWSGLEGSTIKRLYNKNILDTPISIPKTDEQKKIGLFFDNFDNHITLHQRKYEKLVNVKKSMLEKMFPKNGTDSPEIRFKGFNDAWGQCKLDEISDVRDGTHDSPQYLLEGYPFITSKNIKDGIINFDDIQYISRADFEQINKRSKVDENDILMGMIGTIGNIALVREKPNFAIKNVALIKDIKSVYYLYLYHYLQSPMTSNQLEEGMDGGTQKFIALNKIRNLSIAVPESNEQLKVGNYLEHLNHLITLHQYQLDKLKNIKKTCLEKMFV